MGVAVGHHDVIVVSDLHLAAGVDPATGIYDPNEDFFAAGALSRFLDHYLERGRARDRRWRLVILGDFVDFLQVELPRELGAGLTSAEGSLARLDIVAQGHPAVFAALRRWLEGGHRLEIVIGNHDIEFIWPAVQARLRRLVGAEEPALAARVTFHPWVFYLPGILYAEHGHQYDAINSFLTPLAPYLPDDQRLIALPLGSFFVHYLFNAVERVDPFADNVKPMTRYLGWAMRAHPVLTMTTLPAHLRLFLGAVRKTTPMTPAERHGRRERYRRTVLAPAASAIGLPAATLDALDELAAVPTMTSPWEQFRALTLKPVGPLAVGLAAAVGSALGLGRLPAPGRSLRWPLLGLGFLVWREWPLLRPQREDRNGLREAAAAIHELLTAVGWDEPPAQVPAYIFGHTHTAEQSPLGKEPAAPLYLNAGTWTPIVPSAFSLIGARELLSFVEVVQDPETGMVRSSLLVWNDAAGRAEPLRRELARG